MAITFEQETPGEPYYTIASDGEGDSYTSRTFWVETILMGGGDDFVSVRRNGLAGTGQNLRYLERDPLVDMGAGDDTLDIQGGTVTGGGTAEYFGGDGNDVIRFSVVPGSFLSPKIIHTIYGDDDSLDPGGQGNDRMTVGEDWSIIDGGGGIDLVSYNLLLSGGISAKLPDITPGGGQLPGVVFKAAGTDRLLRVEDIVGTQFADFLSGGNTANLINGSGGSDAIFGQNGDDTIIGGEGNDYLNGGDGNDFIEGSPGFDTINAGAGNDVVFGQTEDDFIVLGPGFDEADGGSGTDTISYANSRGPTVVNLFEGTATIRTPDGEERDTLQNFENIVGSVFDDALGGNAASNNIAGGVGNDIIVGLDGNDTLLGQRGNDVIAGNIGDDLILGGRGRDTIDGGFGNDQIFGGHGRDFLTGSVGDDTLVGDRGNDTLLGGAGSDTLTGGRNQDEFVWRAQDFDPGDLDTITDFRPIFDTISIQGVYDLGTAAAEVLTAVQVGSGVVLTADLSGTPGAGSTFFVDDFVFLEGYTIDMVDLTVWQAFGAIEFV